PDLDREQHEDRPQDQQRVDHDPGADRAAPDLRRLEQPRDPRRPLRRRHSLNPAHAVRTRFSTTRLKNDTQTTTVTNSSRDRKSTRLNSSHVKISYAVFCLKKKKSIARDV